MRYLKPNFELHKTNAERAQAFAHQAAWDNNSRAERQTYIDMARLYLDLAILDAGGVPATGAADDES